MDLWGWVIAYVVGFSLLQVLIYRYLRERETSGSVERASEGSIERTAPPQESWNTDGRRSFGEPPYSTDPYVSGEAYEGDAAVGEGRHCPRCGALNEPDPAYTYCRECVRPLG